MPKQLRRQRRYSKTPYAYHGHHNSSWHGCEYYPHGQQSGRGQGNECWHRYGYDHSNEYFYHQKNKDEQPHGYWKICWRDSSCEDIDENQRKNKSEALQNASCGHSCSPAAEFLDLLMTMAAEKEWEKRIAQLKIHPREKDKCDSEKCRVKAGHHPADISYSVEVRL
mmetsp:Transcript_10481/g.14683  ORF Transcript_10481/g.14683 Transcript_10481/m.14683 type:complete len:167 (-) Transcript_10481:95-595(-)